MRAARAGGGGQSLVCVSSALFHEEPEKQIIAGLLFQSLQGRTTPLPQHPLALMLGIPLDQPGSRPDTHTHTHKLDIPAKPSDGFDLDFFLTLLH